jgi:hypothetical protein
LGLETLPADANRTVHADQFRPFLAHFLLMTGRINEAQSVLDSMDAGRGWHETRCTASDVAMHRGDTVYALQQAMDALHAARVGMAYAVGVDVDFMGLMAGRHDYLSAESVTSFIESAVLCARILLTGGRRAEAALLLIEGLHVRDTRHEQCDGCHGLLIRGAAGPSLAMSGRSRWPPAGTAGPGSSSPARASAGGDGRGAASRDP